VPTVAYIANQFPSAVEPYIVDEITELGKRGVKVVACSARRIEIAGLSPDLLTVAEETIFLQPLRLWPLIRAVWLCALNFGLLLDFFERILLPGNEPPARRLRALLHTWLGAYYAVLLGGREVEHIHVHHGYFASWVGMVAARLLGIGFSMTLHGSDLLVHGAYLDTKLANCCFCFTVSEYNRRYILDRYSGTDPRKVILQRMGVDPCRDGVPVAHTGMRSCPVMLAVGRLHPVKDHAFLLRACSLLKQAGVQFACLIAGEGRERKSLEQLILHCKLEGEVKLLGHVSREQLDSYYSMADLVVLTSRSEGIPLVLMEAMVRGKAVLAPAITGIPELVVHGQTGFLYRPGSLDDFVARAESVLRSGDRLAGLQRAAREHVLTSFNRSKNLEVFGNLFLQHVTAPTESACSENPLLQQI